MSEQDALVRKVAWELMLVQRGTDWRSRVQEAKAVIRVCRVEIQATWNTELQRLLASHVEQVKQATARAEVAEQMLRVLREGLGDLVKRFEAEAEQAHEGIEYAAESAFQSWASAVAELAEAAR